MSTGARRALAALGCLGLLAACSAEDPPAASPSASTTATELPTAPPVDEAELQRQEELVQLAAAAQEQAAILNAQEDAIPPRDGPVLGADISWPQCPPGMGIEHKETSGQPMPTAEAEYVVVGLTNGPGFHANPCLADQVAWVKQRGLLLAAYSVISWPDEAAQAEYGGLRGAGYAQAQFNVASMEAAGLDSPLVWLDVEQVPFNEWSADTAANAQVVVGAAQGYLDAGFRVGVYSTPYIWESLVGDLAFGVPEWRAAGQTSQAEALDRCGDDWSIQGGRAVLGQWVQDGRDKNITCPGIEADLGRWFARG
ncbi:hypothetical protein [Nocardioides dilutus]